MLTYQTLLELEFLEQQSGIICDEEVLERCQTAIGQVPECSKILCNFCSATIYSSHTGYCFPFVCQCHIIESQPFMVPENCPPKCRSSTPDIIRGRDRISRSKTEDALPSHFLSSLVLLQIFTTPSATHHLISYMPSLINRLPYPLQVNQRPLTCDAHSPCHSLLYPPLRQQRGA